MTNLANIATIAEAAEICDVGYAALSGAVRRGDLPGRIVNRSWVVDLEDVEIWKQRPRMPRREAVLELWNQGIKPPGIAARLGIKTKSVHKALNRQGIYVDGGGPMKHRIDNAEFIRVWNAAESRHQVNAHFNKPTWWATEKANRLRKRGAKLKKFKPGAKRVR